MFTQSSLRPFSDEDHSTSTRLGAAALEGGLWSLAYARTISMGLYCLRLNITGGLL